MQLEVKLIRSLQHASLQGEANGPPSSQSENNHVKQVVSDQHEPQVLNNGRIFSNLEIQLSHDSDRNNMRITSAF